MCKALQGLERARGWVGRHGRRGKARAPRWGAGGDEEALRIVCVEESSICALLRVACIRTARGAAAWL